MENNADKKNYMYNGKLNNKNYECHVLLSPYLYIPDEDGADIIAMEVAEATTDSGSKDDRLTTPTPVDPFRGLPQLFRPRGFSSDFSEDGEGAASGSRRSSVSDGLAVGGVAHAAATAAARASTLDPRGSQPSAKEMNVFAAEEQASQSAKRTPTPPSSREKGGGEDAEEEAMLTSPVTPAEESSGNIGEGDETFRFPYSREAPAISQGASSRGSNSVRKLVSVNVELLSTKAISTRQPSEDTSTAIVSKVEKGRSANFPPPLKLMSPATPTSPSRPTDHHSDTSPLAVSPGGTKVTTGGFKLGGPRSLPILSPLQATPKPTVSSFPMPAVSTQFSSSPPQLSKISSPKRIHESPPSRPSERGVSPQGSRSPQEEQLVQQEQPIVSCSSSSSEDENDEFQEEEDEGSVHSPKLERHDVPPSLIPASGVQERDDASQTPVVSCSPSSSEDENEDYYDKVSPSPKGLDEALEERQARIPSTSPAPVVSCSPTSSEEEEEVEQEVEQEEEGEEDIGLKVEEQVLAKSSDSLLKPITREEGTDDAQMALEQLSSDEEEEEDNGDRGIFGFEQDLLPERMSFSPAPPLSLSRATSSSKSSPPWISQADDDIVLEEVATLESGMGGAESDVVQSSSLGIAKEDDEESSLSLDETPPTVDTKPLPYIPSPIIGHTGKMRKGGPRRVSRRSGRKPPVALPCSPLVVHFKRSMVPSLRLEVTKKKKDTGIGVSTEKEDTSKISAGFSSAEGTSASSRIKTKAEIKAEHFSQLSPYPVGHAPQTPSSSPTPPSSPAHHSQSLPQPSDHMPHGLKVGGVLCYNVNTNGGFKHIIMH